MSSVGARGPDLRCRSRCSRSSLSAVRCRCVHLAAWRRGCQPVQVCQSRAFISASPFTPRELHDLSTCDA
ncbi:hypothetical protein SEA_MACGULLY_92 [Rhodococcus phage MacGully]|nr:hypothetical protein SEA_MACGULLY_92 [Rhodococcus phage MacGully]